MKSFQPDILKVEGKGKHVAKVFVAQAKLQRKGVNDQSFLMKFIGMTCEKHSVGFILPAINSLTKPLFARNETAALEQGNISRVWNLKWRYFSFEIKYGEFAFERTEKYFRPYFVSNNRKIILIEFCSNVNGQQPCVHRAFG